MNKQFREL